MYHPAPFGFCLIVLMAHEWWLPELARRIGMPVVTLYGWFQRGWVKGHYQGSARAAASSGRMSEKCNGCAIPISSRRLSRSRVVGERRSPKCPNHSNVGQPGGKAMPTQKKKRVIYGGSVNGASKHSLSFSHVLLAWCAPPIGLRMPCRFTYWSASSPIPSISS
jgi:hypothetical protein